MCALCVYYLTPRVLHALLAGEGEEDSRGDDRESMSERSLTDSANGSAGKASKLKS